MNIKNNEENSLEKKTSNKKKIENDINNIDKCKYEIEQNNIKKLIINQLKEEIKTHKNNFIDLKLRSQAEIENIRRRAAIDIEKTHKYSLEKILNELLPVIDSLEKSIELSNKSEIFKIINEGIKLTLQSLISTVKKFGLRTIEKNNIPFNPDIHQAMSLINSKEIPSNYVIMVIQKGYMLNGRLLRPAMVTISKGDSKK